MVLGRDSKKKIIVIMISTFAWGLLAHAFIFFNEIAYHDAAYFMCDVGVGTMSGRWMLDLFKIILEAVFQQGVISLPWFNGVVSLLILGIISYVISEMLNINNIISQVLLSAMLVVYPQVTSMFFYMFTAPLYLIGTLMGIWGVKLINEENIVKSKYFGALFLMAGSVGTYQANIPIILGMMVLMLVKNEIVSGMYKDENGKKKSIVDRSYDSAGVWKKNWLINIVSCILFMVLYFGITAVILKLLSIKLTDYQNIDSWGSTSFAGYLKRVGVAYREFFIPQKSTVREMYPFSTRYLYCLFLTVLFTIQIIDSVGMLRNGKKEGIRSLILLTVFPLAVNFIFVMCPIENIHGVMMYSGALVFVYVIMLLEKINIDLKSKDVSYTGIKKIIYILMILICLLFGRFSNMCYLKAELIQEHCKDYFKSLAERIQTLDEYNEECVILFYGEFDKEEVSTYFPKPLKEITTHPYEMELMLNDYAWKDTMQIWTGFRAKGLKVVSEYGIENNIVKEMPCYPADDSIRRIDNVIIVKFSNQVEE